MPLHEKSMNVIEYIALYMDSNPMAGKPEAVDEAFEQLQKNELVLTVINNLKDFLFCEILLLKDKKKAW